MFLESRRKRSHKSVWDILSKILGSLRPEEGQVLGVRALTLAINLSSELSNLDCDLESITVPKETESVLLELVRMGLGDITFLVLDAGEYSEARIRDTVAAILPNLHSTGMLRFRF